MPCSSAEEVPLPVPAVAVAAFAIGCAFAPRGFDTQVLSNSSMNPLECALLVIKGIGYLDAEWLFGIIEGVIVQAIRNIG